MTRYNLIALFAFCLFNQSFDQPKEKVISLINPSFEGESGHSVPIEGWLSMTPGSTPDLLPGTWGEMHAANHGKTCLGIVMRKEGTMENIGQTLQEPLEAGDCYKFSIDLAKAKHYAKFSKPGRLRVWGGEKPGEKTQLLASSPLIAHEKWKRYTFRFVPKSKLMHITFEASFAPGATFKYNGNILLDNCSVIESCIRA